MSGVGPLAGRGRGLDHAENRAMVVIMGMIVAMVVIVPVMVVMVMPVGVVVVVLVAMLVAMALAAAIAHGIPPRQAFPGPDFGMICPAARGCQTPRPTAAPSGSGA